MGISHEFCSSEHRLKNPAYTVGPPCPESMSSAFHLLQLHLYDVSDWSHLKPRSPGTLPLTRVICLTTILFTTITIPRILIQRPELTPREVVKKHF